MVHHAGKASEGKRKIDRIRGASALYSAARAVLFIEADDRGLAVDVVKFNRAEPPARFVLERTVQAEIGVKTSTPRWSLLVTGFYGTSENMLVTLTSRTVVAPESDRVRTVVPAGTCTT